VDAGVEAGVAEVVVKTASAASVASVASVAASGAVAVAVVEAAGVAARGGSNRKRWRTRITTRVRL